MKNDREILKQLKTEIADRLKTFQTFSKIDFEKLITYWWSGTQGYSIDQYNNVTGLNLKELKLERIPLSVFEFQHLRKLSLYGNATTQIPKEISKLRNLELLVLSSNQLSTFPPEICELTKLQVLYLHNNRITEIPDCVKRLKDLRKLLLYSNRIKTIPPSLCQLENLTELNLRHNQIENLPTQISHLNNLVKLNLWDNKIKTIPDDLIKLPKLGYLALNKNLLETPPQEIARQGIEAIRAYYKSIEGKKKALNEVKVLLVGDGGAGKTSLVKRLLGEEFNKDEAKTHGINIKDWKVKVGDTKICVHFWDFGGQEIMHATHQFFLSKRSLYILVIDSRKDEKTEYWLKHIESFGGDSPVLVVLNKMDENPGFDVNRRFLQDKYKGIKGFHCVSCANGAGIKRFSENLRKALSSVEIIETTWAKSWFNVKKQLENMTRNFISYDEYTEICKRENIIEKTAQDTLIDFLNDLGVILHFKDFKLLDTHVLEPKWVTEAVYKIINSRELVKFKGVLNLSLLDEILERKKEDRYYYPSDKYRYIIDLMLKFELCYEINDQTVLVPDLLEVQEPKIDFDYTKSLKFLIEYDFLPKSVMPRFIVRVHKDIKDEFRWRTGVVLEDEAFKAIAVIKADERDKKIYIYVNGEQRRDYFSVILFTFRYLNKSFKKLKAVEKVSMPDNHSVTMSYQHLIRLERMGVENYIPDGAEKLYKVKELLGTVHITRKTESEILEILKKLKNNSDDEKSLLKKANDTIILQPNFMGVGINLNKLIRRLFNKK